MDGGDVSTGTVDRLVKLLDARKVATIDPEPFYIYCFPGTMETAALFRPHIEIEDGLINEIEMPSSTFYCHEPANLVRDQADPVRRVLWWRRTPYAPATDVHYFFRCRVT